MKHSAAVVVAFVLGAGSLAWADSGGFTFSTPPGWVNVSPGASAADRARVPPTMLEQVDSGSFAFFAADVDHVENGFMTNVNAVVRTGRLPAITPAALDEIQQGAAKTVKDGGFEYQAVKKEIIQIGGVDCGRIVGSLRTPNNTELITVGYVIPGQRAAVTLTFTSQRSAFPRYEAIFDAAARQTQGAAPPPVQTPFWIYGVIAAVSATVASGIAVRKRQKKDSAAGSNEKPPAAVA